jgi:hypothetical protein
MASSRGQSQRRVRYESSVVVLSYALLTSYKEILEYLHGEPPRIRRAERAKMSKKAKSVHRRLVKAYKRNVIKFMEIKDKASYY